MAENSDNQSSVSNFPPEKPSDANLKQPQIPTFPYFPSLQNGDVNMLQIMYPALVPGVVSAQNLEQMNSGPGIYAVPVLSSMGGVTRIPTNSMIPLTYTTPSRRTSSSAGPGDTEQSLGNQDQQQPPQLPHQRPGVQRFQIAFHLDVFLIGKLIAVIFILNHDGSRQRLALLVFLASIVYLYQTGALTPLMRWVSQAMHRAAAPPRPARPAARVEPILREGNEVVVAAAAENDNQHEDVGDEGAENEAPPEGVIEGGNQWWGIVKEIQMIVFGFITTLLPGFHNMDQP